VNYGASQSFTMTPNTGTTWRTCCGRVVGGSGDELHVHQTVTANHTIAASFAINTYTITASAGANGSIAPVGAVTVNYGATRASP